MEIITNRHERPLYSLSELPAGVAQEHFDYMFNSLGESATYGGESPRFFKYRDWWYDAQEFTVAPDDLKAKGWDGVQADSAWTGITVSWFDTDGNVREGIVVGSLDWSEAR